jgi:hypothetical protein
VILRKGESHAVQEVLWRHSIDGRYQKQDARQPIEENLG